MNRKWQVISVGVLAAVCFAGLSRLGGAAGPTDKGGPGGTSPIKPPPMKGQAGTSLVPVMAKLRSSNKLVEGHNKVYEAPPEAGAPGFTIYANVENGKVTKWDATDDKGKSMKVEVQQGVAAAQGLKCEVCVVVIVGSQFVHHCYEIDCNDAPKPTSMSPQ